MRWAALLKGVNVGGNRKLPMADLRAFVADLGFTDAKTLLASGNVVFTAPSADGAAIEAMLDREAAHRLGLETAFLLRNAHDLADVIAGNPFADAAADHPSHLLVTFHRERFDPALIDGLDHSGPERLAARGRELFVDYPENIGDSLLPRAMARARFPAVATARNWNTVNRLAALLAVEPGA